MTVIPACEIRSLTDCQPGQLVRPLNYRGDPDFAILGTVDGADSLAFIFMRDQGATYSVFPPADHIRVLTFEDQWFIEVDHRGPFESRARDMYEAGSCLIREKSRWVLNVWTEDHHRPFERALFDLTSAELTYSAADINNMAVFGRWTLYLGDESAPRERWRKIAAYAWQPPEGPGR